MTTPNTQNPTPSHTDLTPLLSDCPRAWSSFHREYAPVVAVAARRVAARFGRVLNSDAADEICAAFWLEILRRDKHKLRSFDPSRGIPLASWMRMLATRSAYDHLRKSRRVHDRSACMGDWEAPSDQPSAEETASSKQALSQVLNLCRKLSTRDQQFIKLYYQDELEPTEIANQLSISTKTVYTKNHKIRARLQAWTEETREAA